MIADSIKGIFRNRWLVLTLRLFLGGIFIASSILAALTLPPSPSAMVKADTPSDSSVPCSICSGSSINSTDSNSEVSSKPVVVNIQVDLEKEGAQGYVYDILDQIELRNGRTTVFATGEFATAHPDIIRSIESRGHQIAVHGWQKGEDLTLLNYDDQLSLISRAFAAVRGPVSKPEEVVDFKPQGYKFNDDTIRIAQELGAESVSGIFTCQEPFCKCPYAQKLGKITFPYPVTNNFWLVPISNVKTDSKDIPLDDEYINNPQEFLDYLIGKYTEQLQTKDPLIIAIHPSITGADAAKLNALSQFVDYVTNNNGQIKPLSSLTHLTTYIPSLQITSAPQSANPGETVTITVQFGAAIYCPSYYFRIYGKYSSEESWVLRAEHYHGVQTGTFSFSRSFIIPEPPPGDSSYTVRVVGQGCSGTCWPTPYSYERMDEVTVQIEEGLIADFTYSPYPPYNPVIKENIAFDASSSWGAIANYRWDFGDGSNPEEGVEKVRVLHAYSNEGDYLVNLAVTDDEGTTTIVEKTVTVRRPPVILVHGFQSNSLGFEQIEQIWEVMKEELESEFIVHVSHYANDVATASSIRQYALNLKNEIEKMRNDYHVNKVDIVAHSMGGLVSRYYIEMDDGHKYVRKLIMLETPNQGVNKYLFYIILAGIDPWVEALLESLVAEFSGLPEPVAAVLILANVCEAIGEHIGTALGWYESWDSAKEMASDGQFIKALNQNYLLNHKGKVDYSNLGGWLFMVPYVNDFFKLDGAYYERLHGLTDLISGYHGRLPESVKVISKVKFILNDDPVENTENNSADQGLGIQFAPSIVGVVSPGQQNSHGIPIGSAAVANFVLLWSGGNLDLTLVTPSGTSIDPGYAEGDPNMTYYGDENLGIKGYVIKDPESGTWNASITAVNVTGEQSYTLETFLDTDETLFAELEKYQYGLNEMINVRARLSHDNEAITDASVTAEVERPDGSIEGVELYDDGLHNDSEADDGVYGNIYTNTNLLGGYDLTVVATGVHEDRQFARQASCTIWVGDYPDLTLQASDISFPDNTPSPGQVVTINVALHNIGSAEALNASILFYDGEPQRESFIGEAVVNVPAGGVADVASPWIATVGTHIIYAVISPYNAFLEEDYTNNYACKMIDVLEPPALIGTVTDNNGNPAADVYIYAIGPTITSTITDINGSYNITGLQSGSYAIRVEPLSPNLMLTSTSVFINAGQTSILDFTLQTVGSIAGNITDADGIPIPNVSLYLSGYETARYRTDDTGHYVIPRLQAGTYTVNVDASETIFTDASATVSVVLGQTTTLDFILPVFPGGQIGGTVTDANGNGVYNAYVSVSGPSWSSDYTDATGYYFIPRLLAGNYTVTASPPYGVNLVPSSTMAEVVQGETTIVDFVLQVGGMIAGRVTDETEATVPDAYIYAYGPSYGYGYADEEGYYTIFGLPSGTYIVEAYPPYGVNLVPSSTTAEVIQGETTTVDLVLQVGGMIAGRVTDEVGEGVSWAYVYAYAPGYGYGYADEDGYYTIFGLPSGTYVVEAYPPYGVNLVPSSTTAEVIQGEATIIDFVLQAGGIVAGRVTDEAGVGVPDVYIYASGPGYGYAYTDEEGYYSIIGLQGGTRIVSIDASGYGSWYIFVNGAYAAYDTSVTVGVTTGQTEFVDFSQQPPNQLPVANAGPDQMVCAIPPANTAIVTLDGAGSYDADGDPLTYTWTWDGNTAYGVNPIIELPLGTTTITLVVNDGKADSEPDTVDITVCMWATIDLEPDTLNLKSKEKFVTAYIELPQSYDVGQIDVSSIRLNDTVPALAKPAEIGDYDTDGVTDLMVKFDRAAVQDSLTVGEEVDVIITGEVAGIGFEGSDTIRLIFTAAPPSLSEWSRVSTPSEEGWVLAPDSTIIDYAVADGGEVAYAIVDREEGSYHLLKSTDAAASWEDITAGLEALLDAGDSVSELLRVACDTADPNFVAVALWWYHYSEDDYYLSVFFSTDGGDTFIDAGEVEDSDVYFPYTDGAVADLAVSLEASGKRDIAIGGYDLAGNSLLFRCTVTGDMAGAWQDATTYPGWDDDGSPTAFTSLAVVDIQFSPGWATDKTVLVATATDETVHLQSGSWGISPGWNKKSTLGINAVLILWDVDLPTQFIDWDARGLAGITLPRDYNSKNTDTRVLWGWVNYYDYDTGDARSQIVRVENDSADPVVLQIKDGKVWLTNVSYLGTIAEGEAIAGLIGTGTDLYTGCCEGVQVYRNTGIHNMDICCERWKKACKPPTGTTGMAVSFVSEDKAYAVALQGVFPYDEGAWSVTFDGGDIWNQLSLIDTHIDYLSDVAVSPDCNNMMLVSINTDNGCGCDSVWLNTKNLPEADEYSGQWLRTWCGQLENNHGLLRLPADETTGDTVFLVDRMTSNVYQNDLEGLACWESISTGELYDIADVAAQDADTIFALGYYDSDVAMFDEGEWHTSVASNVSNGHTIAVQGDDILVGGWDGDVSYSDNGGETFTTLEDVASSGYVTVAFDTYFNDNATVYAAVASVDENGETTGGVYRWIIGESDEWIDLECEPSTFQLTGERSTTDSNKLYFTSLVLDRPAPANPMTSPDTGGVLYASYIFAKETATGNVTITSGMARCLTPAEDVCCGSTSWDYLIEGLTTDTATLDSWDINFFEQLFVMSPAALKICGCLTADSNSKLFAIGAYPPAFMWAEADGYDMKKAEIGTVWSFEDRYAKVAAPALTSPANGATIPTNPGKCVNMAFTLEWERQYDGCVYDIQIALDENFTDVVVDIRGYEPPAGATPSYVVMKGTLSCGVTYYWRVRFAEVKTGQVIHSWWSEPWGFTVVHRKG